MNYILDTHVVLWIAENSSQLSEDAKSIILDSANVNFVSIASAWETAIKISTGKLKLDGGINEFFRIIDENELVLFPIKKKHVARVQILPFFHRDPFDRLLVATAVSENMSLLTGDKNIHLYDVDWIW